MKRSINHWESIKFLKYNYINVFANGKDNSSKYQNFCLLAYDIDELQSLPIKKLEKESIVSQL